MEDALSLSVAGGETLPSRSTVSIGMTTTTPAQRQAAQYAFPYHWLPQENDGAWTSGRDLGWSYEYLGVTGAVRDAVLGLGPRSVLDFGCGDGRLTVELLERGVPAVTGIDLDIAATHFARGFTAGHVGVTIVCGDVADLDGSFDVTVAMEVLEHIPDGELERVVTALRRLTAGRLVVSVPTTNVPLQAKHERHYDLDLLTEHLAGFTIESVRWLHRPGKAERRVTRLTLNRFGVVRHPRVLRYLAERYKRTSLDADERTGAHLLVVAS